MSVVAAAETLGEDFVYGAAGILDEIDENLGDQTDFAAEAYGAFNPGTASAAEAVENAGGVDRAFEQTFGFNPNPNARPRLLGWAELVFAAALVGSGYYLAKR